MERPAMISEEPGRNIRPCDDLHLRPQGDAPAGPTPRMTTLDGLSDPRLCSEISTTVSFDTSALAVRAERDLRLALHHRRPARGRHRSALRSGRPPDHQHVVPGAGVDQGLAQALVQHQHRGEHVHHQRHAAGGERGGDLARTQVAHDVGRMQRSLAIPLADQPARKPSAMRTREARQLGTTRRRPRR